MKKTNRKILIVFCCFIVCLLIPVLIRTGFVVKFNIEDSKFKNEQAERIYTDYINNIDIQKKYENMNVLLYEMADTYETDYLECYPEAIKIGDETIESEEAREYYELIYREFDYIPDALYIIIYDGGHIYYKYEQGSYIFEYTSGEKENYDKKYTDYKYIKKNLWNDMFLYVKK